METLDKALSLVFQMMWASSFDVSEVFLSVRLHPHFQKFFCFHPRWDSLYFLRLPFGFSLLLGFSRLMNAIKRCLRCTASSFKFVL